MTCNDVATQVIRLVVNLDLWAYTLLWIGSVGLMLCGLRWTWHR